MVVDTHCHLHDPAFRNVPEVLNTALAHDVWGVVAVGCDADSNAQTLAVARAHPKSVWACLGFHPDRLHLTEADLEAVEEQVVAHHATIVGLGEVGLPWYCLQAAADPEAVLRRARRHLDRLLALAARYDLAVSLHAPHGAAAPALEALQRHGIERAVFHWHKAPADVTRAIVEAGYLISVGPEVVYRERDRELAAAVPLDALLVESDAPWTYGGEFEGLPSGPWFAARVAEEVAKIKGRPVEDVMHRLSTNACRLFDLVWA
ncbi:MAG TPA: TatD family hydrolase [Calidithermus sp.]|nr:TatD family hydrolase [Calidithermus sp.]